MEPRDQIKCFKYKINFKWLYANQVVVIHNNSKLHYKLIIMVI